MQLITKKINFKIVNKVSEKILINFLKKISGDEFKTNKDINSAPWKYRKDKKFKFFFVKFKKAIVGAIVIINFKFSRHLSFLYIIKEFRNINLGSKLLDKYFLNTKRVKTVHVKKKLKRTINYYLKKNFVINKNSKNLIIKKWIQRSEKFNNSFATRILMYKS
jgi:ribosomal protein S18 acetylase RimI-like enzyme